MTRCGDCGAPCYPVYDRDSGREVTGYECEGCGRRWSIHNRMRDGAGFVCTDPDTEILMAPTAKSALDGLMNAAMFCERAGFEDLDERINELYQDLGRQVAEMNDERVRLTAQHEDHFERKLGDLDE